jgi:hypothetical protein
MDERVTMIQGSEGPATAGSADDSSGDTMELPLTEEQTLALSRPGEVVHAAAPDCARRLLSQPRYDNFAAERTARVDFVCNVIFAAAALGIATAFLWPASDQHPPAPAVTSAAPLRAEPQPGLAELQGAPVRIRNAFDATEVFEFPPRTNESAARETVAELLLNRARDRGAERPLFRRASTRQPDRAPVVQQPDLFVTRLVARAKEP